MDFFDEIGKKINDAADVIVSKTKSITESTINQTKSIGDITKLKAQKRTIEKNITGYYYQLGKAYYENSGNNCEYIYSELVSAIDSEKDKLNAIISDIDKIGGVVHCDKCGAKLAADSVYCNICGAKLEKEPQPAAEPATEDNIVQETQPAVQEPVEISDNEAAEALTEAPSARFCTECGNKLPDGAAFCTNCGKKYEE